MTHNPSFNSDSPASGESLNCTLGITPISTIAANKNALPRCKKPKKRNIHYHIPTVQMITLFSIGESDSVNSCKFLVCVPFRYKHIYPFIQAGRSKARPSSDSSFIISASRWLISSCKEIYSCISHTGLVQIIVV